MTEEEILNTLDNSNDGYYCSFVDLGHVYSYLIDSRLNVFRSDNNQWAIAIERLGYNPRAGSIILDINYYGNCLINLELYNDRPTSYYSVYPIDSDKFDETTECENLKPDAKYWLVRGQQISLSLDKQDYVNAGIDLKEYEPNEIRVEEAARLVIKYNSEVFRATEDELYKSIPAELKKVLVLDEWFQKEFNLLITPTISDEHLLKTYEFNKNLTGLGGTTFESFAQSFRHQEMLKNDWNKNVWINNRPSTYETWNQIAKVIVTGNPKEYRPTVDANTHWSNWPDSGSM